MSLSRRRFFAAALALPGAVMASLKGRSRRFYLRDNKTGVVIRFVEHWSPVAIQSNSDQRVYIMSGGDCYVHDGTSVTRLNG